MAKLVFFFVMDKRMTAFFCCGIEKRFFSLCQFKKKH